MEMREENREKALETLMERYEQDVLKLCCVYLRDLHLAQDAVQETFLKAYRRMETFREESGEKTWLMRIAVNTCKSIRRGAWFRFVDRRVTLEQLPEPAHTPSDDHLMLTMAVMRLPRREMEAVLLHDYQGMQVKEVAKALGITPSAASARLKRARQRLYDALKGEECDA